MVIKMSLKNKLNQTEENILMERGKIAYQRFCDSTSMHGFSELYHAKTTFWKLFWYICIFIAFFMTGYQIYLAVYQYANQTTATSIEPAAEGRIMYPPLKICYTHWLYWTTFENGYQLGFTKPAILYGLSFLSRIYSTTPFNVTEAKDNFTSAMAMNNMTTLSQFYKTIAKFAPLRFFDEEFYDTNYSRTGGNYFMNTEFVLYQQDNLLFCHVELGEDIIEYITKTKAASEYSTKANTLTFATNDQNYFGNDPQVSSREYNSYMAEWIQERTPQYWIFDDQYDQASHDYTKFNAPMVLFPDGYNTIGIKMEPEIDEYFVTLKATAHKWKNTLKNPCNISIKSVVSDTSCAKLCIDHNNYVPGQPDAFEKRFRLGKDYPDELYSYDIYLINETQNNTSLFTTMSSEFHLHSGTSKSSLTVPSSTSIPLANTELMSSQNKHVVSKKENCTLKCVQGCEKWNFEVSVTTSSIYNSIHAVANKKRTNIRIDYPLDGDVMIMTESDLQSWENFVGNVGGLLGIWTGASIVSFIQLFYLCCCADFECGFSECTFGSLFSRSHKKGQPASYKKVQRIHTVIVNRNISSHSVC